MDAQPQDPREDHPRSGVCVDGEHFAAVVWRFGHPLLPRHICAVHLARAITAAWNAHIDRRLRGLTE